MKKSKFLFSLIFVLSVVFLCGCEDVSDNTQKAIEWINKAKKPITVKSNTMNGWTYNLRYTLIDADGKTYYCGETRLSLPDTLWGGEKHY